MSDEDLLKKISLLKETAKQTQAKLDQAKIRKAVLQDKLETLTKRLKDTLGHRDWSKASDALDTLKLAALEAVESLADALDGPDF